MEKFKLVKIDYEYCNFLRFFDKKVSYNAGIKELRPYIGILFSVNQIEYFAPLSSPKEKHKNLKNNIDFIKIDGGKLGVINLNNMIPVCKNNYEVINLNKKLKDISQIKYQILLQNQLSWVNKNGSEILSKAINLYQKYLNDKLPKNLKSRCCDFPLLEEKCKEYNL
jgi:protein AbiQ